MSAPKHIRDEYEEIIPGFYALVPNEVYHASAGLSSHGIMELRESIAHYLYRKEHPIESDALLKGEATHDAVLLPHLFETKFAMAPAKTKTSKAYKQFVLDNPHKKVLTPQMYRDVLAMREALYGNPAIREILEADTVLRECSSWVHDPHTNVLLKCRPDIIVDGYIYDVKTTIAPHQRAFIHSVFEYRYHIQSAFYQYCCKLAGINVKDFRFLVVGNKPPYLTAIYTLNDGLIEEGNTVVREAIDRYSDYLLGVETWEGLPYGRDVVVL